MTEKIDAWALGMAIGTVWAVYVILLGVAASFGWGSEWVSLLQNVYVGYGSDTVGIVIGGIWAFVDGIIAGALVAVFYNLLKEKF